jgi:hypothetical protein
VLAGIRALIAADARRPRLRGSTPPLTVRVSSDI